MTTGEVILILGAIVITIGIGALIIDYFQHNPHHE
jgi:hypothetical protein